MTKATDDETICFLFFSIFFSFCFDFQMSCQRGSNGRTRKQKYQNATTFKNNLYDTSQMTKKINNLEHKGLCERCKNVLEWKVHFRKYKPLTQPKKWFENRKNSFVFRFVSFFSTRCSQKNILRAYYVVCDDCGAKENLCCKCGLSQDTPIE